MATLWLDINYLLVVYWSFIVQRVVGYHRPLLQHDMHWLPLTGRCCKSKWQVIYILPLTCKEGHCTIGRQLPTFNSFLPLQWKGWWINVAHQLRLPMHWESAHCNWIYAKGIQWGPFYTWETNTYFPTFHFLQVERAMGQCNPLLQL